MRSAVVVPWSDYLAALWTIRCYHCYAECGCCTVFGLPGSSTVWTSMAPPGFVLPHPVAFLQQKSDQGCLWNVLWWFKVSQLSDLTIHLTIVRERERERTDPRATERVWRLLGIFQPFWPKFQHFILVTFLQFFNNLSFLVVCMFVQLVTLLWIVKFFTHNSLCIAINLIYLLYMHSE